MKLLSEIIIHREKDNAAIQLLQGDLTSIPNEHTSDILVISAFPGDYAPVSNTLIGAFYNKGINVGELAKDKEVNLIGQLGCWLSKPLSEDQQKLFNFKRILCFEPGKAALENETVVSNIFRCINTFAFDRENNVITMPVVASGNQKVPLRKMLPATLEAAIFWLENGLPLKFIKLVLHTDIQVEESLPIFNKLRQDYETKGEVIRYSNTTKGFNQNIDTKFSTKNRVDSFENGLDESLLEESSEELISSPVPDSGFNNTSIQPLKESDRFDYFISYAHTHSDLIYSFVQSMKLKNSQLRIFYDKDTIPPGGLWIKQISDAIQKARKVIVFLSPDYDNSPVCWDEFQCAKLIEYKRKTSVIQTIYLYNYKDEMPPIMGIYSYLDCREGDLDRLKAILPELMN